MIDNIIRGKIEKQEAAHTLEKLIRYSQHVSGELLYGAPFFKDDHGLFTVDAVLVSDRGQVTVLDLVENQHPGDYVDRQDHAYNLVRAQLANKRQLTRRRDIIVPVQTVTFSTKARQDDLSDPEHPVISPGGILHFISHHQSQDRQTLDPTVVMDAIMHLGTYEW